MKSQSRLASLLTQPEVDACLKRAFAALPTEDQENVERAVAPLTQVIRGMGTLSALQLIFAIDRADDLARLDETLKGG
jgi:hypothetical protein